jgi:hypothetical protein
MYLARDTKKFYRCLLGLQHAEKVGVVILRVAIQETT